MSADATPKKKGGRPRKYPGEGRRPTLSLRVRGGLYEKLKEASEQSERTISEEMERRLEDSFTQAELIAVVAEATRNATLDTATDFIKKIFGGEKYYLFGSGMAGALYYAMHAEEILDVEIHEVHKYPEKREWIEKYVSRCLSDAFEKRDGIRIDMALIKSAIRQQVDSKEKLKK